MLKSTPVISFIDNEIGKPAMKSIKAGQSPALPLTDYQRELLDVRNKCVVIGQIEKECFLILISS